MSRQTNWPKGVAQPAQRALAAAGLHELTQLTHISEAELLQLHGMGPKAVRLLREALAEQNLTFGAQAKPAQKDYYVNSNID
jgi:DNA-directed RNA polymerase alpha subunit